MKIILAVLVLTLSGCASYNTHLRTGCIWSCDSWSNQDQLAITGGDIPNTYTPSAGITSQTYITPVGSYQVIRSGSTTSIIQTSKGK
jgi:hypothetical protein